MLLLGLRVATRRVEKAESLFRMVELESRGYYQTLREKLGWGGNFRT